MRRKGRSPMARADELYAALVRGIGRCERCGATSQLQCAHVVPRHYHATRTDLRNALCLCAPCHLYFTHRPLEWEEWVRAYIGADLYDELRRLALAGGKVDWRAEATRLATDAPPWRPGQ